MTDCSGFGPKLVFINISARNVPASKLKLTIMQRLAASSLLRLSTCSLRPGLLSDRAITYSTRPIFDLIPSKPLTARQKDKERNRLRSVSADMRPTDASTPEKRWESYVEVIQNPISRSEPGPQLAPTMTIFKGKLSVSIVFFFINESSTFV